MLVAKLGSLVINDHVPNIEVVQASKHSNIQILELEHGVGLLVELQVDCVALTSGHALLVNLTIHHLYLLYESNTLGSI